MKLFVLHIIVLLNFSLFAENIESTQDGKWATNATWNNNYPDSPNNCYDTITINHDVQILKQPDLSDCGPVVIIINGTLAFKQGNKLELPAGSEVFIVDTEASVYPLGGGGNASLISIGGQSIWRTSTGLVSGPAYSDGSTNLPVEFLSIHYDNSRKKLNWQTASETNNNYFIIQRSQNGIDFKNIGYENGAGNSNQIIDYSFKDINPLNKTSYYRLKQIDYDDKFTYSKILSVNNNEVFTKIKIYPNPNKGSYFYIQSNLLNNFNIYLIDINNKIVFSKNIYLENTTLVNFDKKISKGIYTVRITNKEYNYITKLVIF